MMLGYRRIRSHFKYPDKLELPSQRNELPSMALNLRATAIEIASSYVVLQRYSRTE